MTQFVYNNEYFQHLDLMDCIEVNVPKNITDKVSIFELYSSKLHFPDYFGWNWDAFFECMITLPDTNAKNIVILHNDLPFIEDEQQRNIYIFLLKKIVQESKQTNKKLVLIHFPEQYKEIISQIEDRDDW